MSSPISGEAVEKLAKKPGVVTWAALAAILQLGMITVPGAMRLQALETKMEANDQQGSAALQRHVVESNSRYTEIIRQLTRIEVQLEHVGRGRRRDPASGQPLD